MKVVALLLSTTALAQQAVVDVPDLGTLNGLVDSFGYDGVATFLGIPFAKPPVGSLRWQPPVPYGAWESPRDATKAGHSCIQYEIGLTSQPVSEDCLYLNIATPTVQLSSDEKLAVMLWIYGGSYNLGDAAPFAAPSNGLVTTSDYQVVFAAMNYRLNVFGVAASAEIQARSSDGSAGNFALQDQRLAMVWVRDHIAAFGGDGARVTIFGESAGGNSVMNHLAFPASAGLFQRAIIESGTYNSGSQSLDNAQEKDYAEMKKRTGCDDLDCLLAVTNTTELMPSEFLLLSYPAVDGVAQMASAESNIRNGQYHNNVDVLLGSNRDEIALFVMGILPGNLTDAELNTLLLVLVKNPFQIAKIKKLYDPANYEYPMDLAGYSQDWWKAVRMATDGGGLGRFKGLGDTGAFALGHCGARHLARDLKAGGTPTVYQYLFERGTVVKHGDEIGYAFGHVNMFTDETDKALARAMGKYWSSFAVTGVPSASGLPSWPEYHTDSDMILRLNEEIFADSKVRSAACDNWDEHPVHFDPDIIAELITNQEWREHVWDFSVQHGLAQEEISIMV